jgi:DNA invertase Pin-like site-specific DNA recombinase
MIASTPRVTRAAIYARVSTHDQTCENQLLEVHRYVTARGWTAQEYIDQGISGAKDRRPALDSLLADARRRRFDVLVVWRLDRLGRNLKHLVTLLEEIQALGIAFVSLAEGIDATTPAGKLQMHILAAIAERVRAGLARAKAQGRRLGRRPHRITDDQLAQVANLSTRRAAAALAVPSSVLHRARGRHPMSDIPPTCD